MKNAKVKRGTGILAFLSSLCLLAGCGRVGTAISFSQNFLKREGEWKCAAGIERPEGVKGEEAAQREEEMEMLDAQLSRQPVRVACAECFQRDVSPRNLYPFLLRATLKNSGEQPIQDVVTAFAA